MEQDKRTKLVLQNIIGTLRLSNRLIQQAKETVQPYGMNATEFSIVEFLFHKGAQPVQKVAQRALLTSGSTTYVIDCLIRKGLVDRVASKKDKRIYYISLTEKGQTLMEELFPIHEREASRVFQHLTDDELETLQALLKKLEPKNE